MGKRKYTYRFKTLSEFKDEFGDNWREIVNLTWVEQMDWALGQYIKNEKRGICGNENMLYDMIDDIFNGYNDHFSYFVPRFGGFNASIDMIIKEKLTPDYKPKKFIR